jgi:hypothetical protein
MRPERRVHSDWSAMPARRSGADRMVAKPDSARVPWPRVQLVGVLGCAALLAQGGIGVTGAGARMARSAATAPTTIAELHYGDEQSVRAWNGIQAWNDYNTDDMRWHVFVRSGGQISGPPAIPAGDSRLRVDVGPGPGGKPALAYVNCAEVCRVVVSALDGSGAQPVPGSTGASAATIWGSRVAWVRRGATVWTRRLDGGAMERVPGPPLGYGVGELELHGSRLAFIAFVPELGEGGQTEVRMQSLRGGRQVRVAAMSWGSANQGFQGPSWARGKLFFNMSRPSRRLAGPYRYDPRRGRYAKAPDTGRLTGFAMDDDGRRAFEALDASDSIGAEPEDVTRLQLTGPLRFTPTRPPLPKP